MSDSQSPKMRALSAPPGKIGLSHLDYTKENKYNTKGKKASN